MEVMKNNTKIDKNAIMQFNFYHNNRSVLQKIINVLSIVFAIIMLYSFINSKELAKLLFALIFIFIIVLCKIVNKWFVNFKFKNNDFEDDIFEYVFYEEYFTVNNDKYNYEDMKKVKKDNNYIYLYSNSRSAFIINNDIDIKKLELLIKNSKIK